MKTIGIPSQTFGLADQQIKCKEAHWNRVQSELIEESIINKEGHLADTGALAVDTGTYTGRSPKDRFIVKDQTTEKLVWWGDINQPISSASFDQIYHKMLGYLDDKKVYVRDMYAGADKTHRLRVRFINTLAWHNLFCYNMFLKPETYKLASFVPDFTVICCPDFRANPETDGVRQENFAIINFTKKMILIGGTHYSGEMKKGIFSVLNFILPVEDQVLSMHCSANMAKDHTNTAIFFGLSGTGKTTLSADPERLLIGDDEHGWTQKNVFNFEGGCYAKVLHLSQEKEPDIWRAIKYGAIVENTTFLPNSREVDYTDNSKSDNTRVSYPIAHIRNAISPSIGGIPKNIFFLTCDAFGVIPPIQRLSKAQAMYHFISGYTSKVAGTEAGVTDPEPVFSACFGAPFLPLHPTTYAEMLGEKMETHEVKIWMINTGWTGGSFGVGKRIQLAYTRAMITAVLEQKLDDVGYRTHSIFGTEIPMTCPGVPSQILSPRETWKDDEVFYQKANDLAKQFIDNFKAFEDFASPEILAGGPQLVK